MRQQWKKYGIILLLAAMVLYGGKAGLAADSTDVDYDQDYEEDTEPVMISECRFAMAKTSYSYTGKEIRPSVQVTASDVEGKEITLAEGVDYCVQYEDNTNYGVGRAIVLGMGKYTGYHVMKFGILPQRVTGVKVKSPFYREATVTWKKAKGADGYYVYRKDPGGKYKFIANITDGNYEVFHDKSKSLKSGKKYSYQIYSYVRDSYSWEEIDGDDYTRPSANRYGYYDEWDNDLYTNTTSYYNSYNNQYYDWYNYSCIKGKCKLAFLSEKCGTAGGKVTKTVTGKRYAIYTGDADIDYMAYLVNKGIIKGNMSTSKRVEAIFNWMVKKCTFTKDVKNSSRLKKMKRYINYTSKTFKKKSDAYEKKVMSRIYKGQALCIGSSWHDADRAAVALAYRKGSCSFLTPMFNVLCNAAGVEAYIVDGEYVNRDKSRAYHNWSFAKIGKKYYWFDVPVACKNKKIKNSWYKKGTKYWKTCHSWSKSATRGYEGAVFQK